VKSRKRVQTAGSGLIKLIRKPLAPPARVEPDAKRYDRPRQRRKDYLEALRELDEGESRKPADDSRKR
jgi:hypothetical protein